MDRVRLFPNRTNKGDAIKAERPGLGRILRRNPTEGMDGRAAFGFPALEDDLVFTERPAGTMILL